MGMECGFCCESIMLVKHSGTNLCYSNKEGKIQAQRVLSICIWATKLLKQQIDEIIPGGKEVHRNSKQQSKI